MSADLPSSEGVTLFKDVFDFFQCSTRSLWEAEEDVYESGKIECPKDEVGLPSNIGEPRGDSPSQSKIKQPTFRPSQALLNDSRCYNNTNQLADVDNATAFARTRIGKISAV